MPHPQLCRSLLFPAAQAHSTLSFHLAAFLLVSRTHSHTRTRVICASLSLLRVLSFSISLCFLNAISLYFCLTSVLSTCLFRFFVPSLPVQLVPPSCFNTPTCHVAVWVHVHVVAHSGARPTAAECGCGVPTELRVRTTVPRTHHSVPHSCLAFSRDRLSGGPRILQSIRPIDRSIPQPLSSLRLFSSPCDSSGRLLVAARSKTRIQR